MIKLSGDRKHPIIRLASRIRRRYPWVKKFVSISLWDGYSLGVHLIAKQK